MKKGMWALLAGAILFAFATTMVTAQEDRPSFTGTATAWSPIFIDETGTIHGWVAPRQAVGISKYDSQRVWFWPTNHWTWAKNIRVDLPAGLYGTVMVETFIFGQFGFPVARVEPGQQLKLSRIDQHYVYLSPSEFWRFPDFAKGEQVFRLDRDSVRVDGERLVKVYLTITLDPSCQTGVDVGMGIWPKYNPYAFGWATDDFWVSGYLKPSYTFTKYVRPDTFIEVSAEALKFHQDEHGIHLIDILTQQNTFWVSSQEWQPATVYESFHFDCTCWQSR